MLTPMKTCGRCKRRRRSTSFNKKGARLQSHCRDCQHERHAEWARTGLARESRARRRKCNRAKLRELVLAAKSKPCADCGETYHPYVMDFDHVPGRGEKLFDIAMHGRDCLSERTLLAEIAKCDVVCANCHRERTHQRFIARSSKSKTLGSEPREQGAIP